MTNPAVERWTRFITSPVVSRLFSGVLAGGSGTVLVIARWLEPAVQGHGTHLQLGLGECTVLVLFGVPCPMCGVTTTFSMLAHLRVVEAFINQPFGVLMFALTVATFAISLTEVISPRGRWGKISVWSRPYDPWLAAGFLSFMGAGWAYKMWLMGVLTWRLA